jgi:rod shape-determining protein MreB
VNSGVRDSSEHAGAREVYLFMNPWLLRWVLELMLKHRGNMIVDIGGGSTEIAVISLGGL